MHILAQGQDNREEVDCVVSRSKVNSNTFFTLFLRIHQFIFKFETFCGIV